MRGRSPTYSHIVYFDLNSRRQIRSAKISFINNSNSKTRNSFRFILEIGPSFFFSIRDDFSFPRFRFCRMQSNCPNRDVFNRIRIINLSLRSVYCCSPRYPLDASSPFPVTNLRWSVRLGRASVQPPCC